MPPGPAIDDAADPWTLLPGRPERRRRLIARSALRLLGTAVALLVIYAATPVPGASRAGPILLMIGGFAVFLVVTSVQIRSIVRSEHPVLRAIEVVAFTIVLLLVAFAFTYLSLSRNDARSFTEPLNRVDAMYYTVSTVTTVGPGDITPTSEAARVLVTVQMLLSLVVIGFVVRLIALASRAGLRRKGTAAPADGGEA